MAGYYHTATDQPRSFPQQLTYTQTEGQPHSIPGARRYSREEADNRPILRARDPSLLPQNPRPTPASQQKDHFERVRDPTTLTGAQPGRLAKGGRSSSLSGEHSLNHRQTRDRNTGRGPSPEYPSEVGVVFQGARKDPQNTHREVFPEARDRNTGRGPPPEYHYQVQRDPQREVFPDAHPPPPQIGGQTAFTARDTPEQSTYRARTSPQSIGVQPVSRTHTCPQLGEQPVSKTRTSPPPSEAIDSEDHTNNITKQKQGFDYNQLAQEPLPYQAQGEHRHHHHEQQYQSDSQQHLQQYQLDSQQHLQAHQQPADSRPPDRDDTSSGRGSKTAPSVQASSTSQAMGETVSRVTGGVFQGSEGGESWSPFSVKPPENCSTATLENERYQLNDFGIRDHENEDRYFSIEGGSFQVFGVFDGHDGCKAAGFASNYMAEVFGTDSWKKIMHNIDSVPTMMEELFLATERDFFKGIQRHINERKRLQDRIPQGMTSYDAYQLYPSEVTRMQSLEPKIAGGCTAVLAVICNNHLFVANTGDSRALLIRESQETGALYAEQLSEDHTIESEKELQRLEDLGLSRAQMIKAGRLGTQENTRSIGDYYVKEGYKNVDSLRGAKSVPGLALPYVMTPKRLDASCRYLILMTDGVYKSIEDAFENQSSIESNKVLLGIITHALQTHQSRMDTISDTVLSRIRRVHYDTYQKNAAIDQRSPLAVACRKRDDMTLSMYKISNHENP